VSGEPLRGLHASVGPDPGLCGSCANSRVVETRTGSRFFLCQLSAVDPAFPRYPRLPVLRCRGYTPAPSQEESDP
jgi:hypothetical protein